MLMTMVAAAEPSAWQLDPDADLVLSEVHVGAAPSATMRHTSVFRFLWPAESGGAPASAAPSACASPGAAAAARGAPALLGGQQSARSCRDHAAAVGAMATGCDDNRSQAGAEDDAETQAGVTSGAQLLDEDGDVIVKRRRAGSGNDDARLHGGIVIHHALATSLNQVGRQVWRGALLLADLVLAQPQLVAGHTAVELGAGCGLAGLAAARAGARRVLLTDLPALTPACQENAAANAATAAAGPGSITVHGLDWREPPPMPTGTGCSGAGGTDGASGDAALRQWAAHFGWADPDLAALQQAQVFLAADTVYDDELTDAFMATAQLLLQPGGSASGVASGAADSPSAAAVGAPPGAAAASGSSAAATAPSRKRMFVALELRYNFTLQDMDTRASAYEHWRSLFDEAEVDDYAGGGARGSNSTRLVGRQWDVAVVPQVLDYDRGSDLALWELWSAS